ncbi:hypothetical protein LCGC14_1171650 [marine sediment metagenome]|uniref:Uncharacterized protein n=1 Tax=marine sediment metagenome TaxID=412755 RepID=A0A0F9LPN3_9ZZZZ
MQKKNIGMSSRGDEDEKLRLVADLLHAEQHAVETLTKEPGRAKELTKTIDDLRATRQEAVRIWSGENINPNYWCETKHLLEASRRTDELIENASRINPDDIPKLIKISNKVNKERDIAIKNFKQGKTKVTDEDCYRCEDDLGKENYEKLKVSLSETKSLNRSMPKENNNLNNHKKGGISMTDFKQLGVVNGAQFAGKAITVGTDFLDRKYPPSDGSILKRKGLLVNVILGLGGQIGAIYLIKNQNLKLATLIASSHVLTRVVDYAMEAASPAARARLPATRAPLRVTSRPTMNNNYSGNASSLITID